MNTADPTELTAALAAFLSGPTVTPAPRVLLGATPPAGQVTAAAALERLATLYQTLQAQGGRILRLYGTHIPCAVQQRHNAAVVAYVADAARIFADLQKQGKSVKQTLVGIDGKPGPIVTGTQPAVPITFKMSYCTTMPALNGFAGAQVNDVGGLGFPWPVVIFALAAIAGIAVGTGIYVHGPGEAEKQVFAQKAWLDVKLSCVERVQGLNLPAQQAAAMVRAECGPEALPPPVAGPESIVPPGGDSPWAMIGVVAVAVVVGGVGAYMLFRQLDPGARARRQLIEDADVEAKRLRAHAKAISREARTPELVPGGRHAGYARRRRAAPVDDDEGMNFGPVPAYANGFGGIHTHYRKCY